MAALATVAPQLKQIGKHGTSHHGKYARLEDIDRAIRPIISKEGFSLSFDTQPVGNNIRVICKLSHKEGHEEVKQLDLPIDTSGSKNGAQAVKSTVSYGRRILTQMFFNLIEEGEDTDGEIKAPLTAEQASALNNLIKTKGAPMHRFLKHMKVEKIEDILQRDYQHAFVTLRDWKSPVTSGQTK